jgi:hypothetical protein
MTKAKKILSVALHPGLAETRSLLIRSVGLEVKTVFNLQEMQEACQRDKYDLLLVTQGISEKEKRRIILEFRKLTDKTPILEIYDISPDLPDAEFRFHSLEGPEAFTIHLKTILAAG